MAEAYHGIKPVTPSDLIMARQHLNMNKSNLKKKIVDHQQAFNQTNVPASKRYNQSHLANHKKDLTKVNQSLSTLSNMKGDNMANAPLKKTGSTNGKSNATGGGGRFQQLVNQGKSPALAAFIGQKKYGKKTFAAMAAKGKK